MRHVVKAKRTSPTLIVGSIIIDANLEMVCMGKAAREDSCSSLEKAFLPHPPQRIRHICWPILCASLGVAQLL